MESIIIVMRMASYNLPTFSLDLVSYVSSNEVLIGKEMTDVLSFLEQNHFF